MSCYKGTRALLAIHALTLSRRQIFFPRQSVLAELFTGQRVPTVLSNTTCDWLLHKSVIELEL